MPLHRRYHQWSDGSAIAVISGINHSTAFQQKFCCRRRASGRKFWEKKTRGI